MSDQDQHQTEDNPHDRRRSDHANERLFFIKRSTWLLMRRMAVRSVVLAVLTVLGGMLLSHLVDSGRLDRFGIVHQFPELLTMLRASAIMTFIEMSIFWIRLAVTPQLDVQEYAKTAAKDPMAAAIIYVTNTLQWAARVGMFLFLMGG
jgi:hypothetical protein